MASDTLVAARTAAAVDNVWVVTADATAASVASSLGALVIIEATEQVHAGLNAALRRGCQVVGTAHPDRPLAILTADLPALRSGPLDEALLAAHKLDRAVVADVQGTGTTLLTSRRPERMRPAFGRDSHARHLAAGAVAIDASECLRRDVDTAADLAAALRLGVGVHTRQLA
jgi:2-phospho-L-lactate guanylyltransferase